MAWALNSGQSIESSRIDAASTFLNTGLITPIFGGTGCTSSSQCASGYKCVGGRCVQNSTSGGAGGGGSYGGGSGSSGGGDCGGDGMGGGGIGGGGTGGCSKPTGIGGGGTGCTTSTCGQGSYSYGEDSDCCGTRCCRYFATGLGGGAGVNVNCYCGDCPGRTGDRCGEGFPPCDYGYACIDGRCQEKKPCNAFCAAYYESNGAFAAGCSGRDICDECTECTGTFQNGGGNYCDQKASIPCHCEGSGAGECDICANDGTIIPGECLECCTVQNYNCGCGIAVTAQVCQPKGKSGLSVCNQAQNAAYDQCQEECSVPTAPPDPCAPKCEGKTSSGNPGGCTGTTAPDAQDGFKNTWTGCIETGDGNHTILYDECDYTDLPDECKGCDCNCHNDCPPCQLCGADGTCYQDPSPECACGGAPKCGNACCQEGETCIESEPGNEATRTCCNGEPVAIYRSVWNTGGFSNSTYDTVGPPEVALSPSCINCNGDGAICGTYCARPRMLIKNFFFGSGACTGGIPITVAFADAVAPTCCNVNPGWNPVSFPTMISQEILSVACCPKD